MVKKTGYGEWADAAFFWSEGSKILASSNLGSKIAFKYAIFASGTSVNDRSAWAD